MKPFFLFLLALLFLGSCQKDPIVPVVEEEEEEEVPVMEEENVISKRGVGFNTRTAAWSHKASELGVHWMYSWGNTVREEVPENVAFFPMFWGRSSVNDENLARIKQLVADGKVEVVLGFNEPDGEAQANMSVDEAIALWPRLEELGVPLVSPATVNPNNEWMQEFMQKANALNLRVDYVAVHHYGGTSVDAFINKLKQTHDTYNRPIWITEFAVADWNAATPEENRHSTAQVEAFMVGTLAALDELEWVQRYAWFNGKGPNLHTSALYDEDNNITRLGQVYAGINPNEDIGPGIDTEFVEEVDEDELLVNGTFEVGRIEPWGGFKNSIASAAATEPHSGSFCGQIQNGDGSLLYIREVEPGASYTLKFFSKWKEVVTNTFSAKLRNNDGNDLLEALPDMPMTDQWEETTHVFTVPEGVTELKMAFYKGQGFPPFYMDDVSLKKNE